MINWWTNLPATQVAARERCYGSVAWDLLQSLLGLRPAIEVDELLPCNYTKKKEISSTPLNRQD